MDPRFRRFRGRLQALLAATALAALAAAPLTPAAAESPESTATRPSAENALGRTSQVTLVTGDVVVLHVEPGGRQAAWIEEPATQDPGLRAPRIYETDGQVHVIPAEAEPYLNSGALDDRLFNVTYLVKQGYDDASRTDLPLVVTAPDGVSASSSATPPNGSHVERELPSIGAVSVAADKTAMREVWESLRGPEPTTAGVSEAELAGAGRVWLNGRVRATLDQSVAQIGAPDAWAAGYDGTGVPVAVLDTGHDPSHPDLAGRVSDARNFTDDVDPEGQTAVDGHGHGTHVAATIAGTGAASDGTRSGVAPGADLLVGKVLTSDGDGYEDWIIAGMEWAVEQGARVVSMSLGTPYSSDGTDPMSEAVNRLTESSGALFVVAAGNMGPFRETIASPGAATSALTVGAVDKNDRPADFSSRGPRWSDGAIKPEIVAPGVGIVAARAAGTSLGNLVDEHYTALNGTSMATPHVAGAAAILAQQHPDWTAEDLKARLVSTSVTLDGQPVTFQGGGRVDVAAATTAPVTVNDGALSFGRLALDSEPVTRTLTYRNPTDRRVSLALSAEVTKPGGGERPALRLSTTAVSIPAGGDASVEVTVSPSRTPGGDYSGQIVARDARTGSAIVHTATAFTVESPLRTVTVTATDREGKPASGRVEMWNTDTMEPAYGFMWDGAATLTVPEGPYTVMTSIETSNGTDWPPLSQTVAGVPELTVRRDVALEFDARQGERLDVTTPRDADVSGFDVVLHREIDGRSMSSIVAQSFPGQELFTIPSRSARSGTFELVTRWQLLQPLLTAHTTGSDGVQVLPSPVLASLGRPYVGESTLRVVDVGTGTPEEFATADVDGKIALVSRRGEWGELALQVEAAAEAGAVMVLAANDRPGTWTEEVWSAAAPAYRIDADTGATLRELLATSPGAALDVVGLRDSTYSYELAFTERGSVPTGRTYDVRTTAMATIESDYRQNSERMVRGEMYIAYPGSSGLGAATMTLRNGPVRRTEYVNTEGVQWNQLGRPHEGANMYWTWTGKQTYQAGETRQRQWWGPLVHPGTPALTGFEEYGMPVARFHDAIRILMPHYLYDNGASYGEIQEQLSTGDRSALTLSRDGEVVGTSTWPQAQFTVPAADGVYDLNLSVINGPGNWADTSVRTDTTWRFRSARTDAERAVLPLVQANYELESGPYNEVPAGAPYPLVVTPGYQPGATGPGGFTTTVEVSYDDGATWTEAPVEVVGDSTRAMVPAAPGAGFASVRVVATDSAGNRLTQQIDRAWKIAAE